MPATAFPVILESPFAPTPATASSPGTSVQENTDYARACMHDALHRGAAPMASHLLYTQPGVLEDEIPAERALGIAAGFAWRTAGVPTWVYVDLGISSGMLAGIEHARRIGSPIVLRSLHPSQPRPGSAEAAQAPEGVMALPSAEAGQVLVPVLVGASELERLRAALGPALVETAD